MGKEQMLALVRVMLDQLELGNESAVTGTWSIRYDAQRQVFYFEKCEDGVYCEERPAVIDLQGNVIDRGGPILTEEN
jgi:hypothetical protein